MGTGDLNLLKSWNPHLLKNKKKVWETEQNLLEENKKYRERQQEIERERQIDELSSLTRNGTSSYKKNSSLDWMYNDEAATSEHNKDFLLGKKRIEASVLENKESEKPTQGKNGKAYLNQIKPGIHGVLNSNRPKPSASLSRDDPLAAFQRAKESRVKRAPSKITKSLPKNIKQERKHQNQASNKLRQNLTHNMDY
ncbi:LAME_0G02960g1_1 [Lachancea meyersii CBS 8951]|uniref:Pre-mRNA-splicing factor CWC25 n=1 Tax=Lachancea meyersii CBS 8951 TaxID=1266667 RepID=A0A1G4K681_9SACH|nr:LAME_0G02960g1_1 [Lachancea meyersii CBS 8951]